MNLCIVCSTEIGRADTRCSYCYEALVSQGIIEPEHADYPHEPGRLDGCEACETGPCECNPETDAPCVSGECVQADEWEAEYREYRYG